MSQPSRASMWMTGLIGSVLMFAGWVLAIVPAFRHLQRIGLVLAVAIIGFGLVLIPAGVDFLVRRPAGGKRGPRTIVVSMLPSAVIFFIAVAVLPLAAVFRVLAVVCEIAGMVVYGWSWWGYRSGARSAEPERGSRRG